MFRPVEFQSEGATIRGRLYRSTDDHETPRPAVVMAHGITATVTMVIDRYAEYFCEAGFVVLLFEHRNFGISDGEPRREINPWLQARGYRDALDFIGTVGGVDPGRLALWGDSFSGGIAMVAAADEPRVKALVVQVPACGRSAPEPDPTGEKYRAIRETLLHGDITGTPETTEGPMPVVSFDQARHPSMLKPLTAYRWFIEYGGRHMSGWENDTTRVTPNTPQPFNPVLCAPYINAATLMMVSPDDEMAGSVPAVSRLAYESLPGPKEWYDIAGGHFGLVWHPSGLFDEATRVQRDFLLKSL